MYAAKSEQVTSRVELNPAVWEEVFRRFLPPIGFSGGAPLIAAHYSTGSFIAMAEHMGFSYAISIDAPDRVVNCEEHEYWYVSKRARLEQIEKANTGNE